jgi:hypothetical protein
MVLVLVRLVVAGWWWWGHRALCWELLLVLWVLGV